MLRTFVKSKIHRAVVTDADLNYMGSISICPELMRAAGMLEFEFVHVNNLSNGFHWETYALAGKKGEITLNGPPARNFCRGDKVVILTLLNVPYGEEDKLVHTVVFVDESNAITEVVKKGPGAQR